MSRGRTFQSVQVLRAVAALLVVYVHAMGAVTTSADARATAGIFGVDLFFLISGFIVVRASRGRSPGEFLKARLIRVLPPFYVLSIPWLVMMTMGGHYWPDVWAATVTLWPVYDKIVYPALGVGWSLCFEMLFYVCVALSLASRRFLWALLIGYAVALTILPGPLFTFLGHPLILEFLAGAAIGRWWDENARPRLGLTLFMLGIGWWLAGSVVSPMFAEHPIEGTGSVLRLIAYGPAATLMLFGALSMEPLFAQPFFKPVAYLGLVSYSLYLVHTLTLKFLPPMPVPLSIALCVAAGIATYHLIEQPLLNALRSPKRELAPAE